MRGNRCKRTAVVMLLLDRFLQSVTTTPLPQNRTHEVSGLWSEILQMPSYPVLLLANRLARNAYQFLERTFDANQTGNTS